MSILENAQWARRLKLRHFEIFQAVYEDGTLTAAAARLHMTQPALSHWLSDLESDVGTPLFIRDRKLTLTPMGTIFRQHASRVLGDVQRANEEMSALRAGLRGQLRIGSGLPRILIPECIADLHKINPDIFVSVEEAPFTQLIELLENHQIDLIIGALGAEAHRSGFTIQPLINDSIQVLARDDHSIFLKGQPHWNMLASYPWILPPAGAEMRRLFDSFLASQNLTSVVPCAEAGSSIRAHLLMGNDSYLSIFLASEAKTYSSLGLSQVSGCPKIEFPAIGAIWNAQRAGPVLDNFLEILLARARVQHGTVHS